MKAFFSSLCIILISYGSATLIKNGGATAKMTRFVFAVCLLCSVISVVPFVDLSSMPFSVPAQTQYANYDLSEDAFRQAVGMMLTQQGIEFKNITLYSSKNEDGSINIEKIRVSGASNKEKAQELIKVNTGIEKIEVS